MVIVSSNAGLANRIKNIVSAGRLAELTGDNIFVDFPTSNIFSNVSLYSCANLGDSLILPHHRHTTWSLMLHEQDGKTKQFNRQRKLVDEAYGRIYPLHSPDFQYSNTHKDFIDLYSKYFDFIKFTDDINDTVANLSRSLDIHNCIGLHVRTWIDSPSRKKLLYDLPAVIDILRSRFGASDKILLCSDDESIGQKIQESFDGRILRLVGPPITHTGHSRDSLSEIRASIEILLLAKCHTLIPSYLSTFSEVAWWFGGCKNNVIVPIPRTIREFIKNCGIHKMGFDEGLTYYS